MIEPMEGNSEGVRFGPMFDDPREMQDFFDQNGFNDYAHFAVYDTYCSIIFNTPKRDLDFFTFINGRTINDIEVTAHLIYHPKISQSPNLRHEVSPNLRHEVSPNLRHEVSPNLRHKVSPVPRIHSRTIVVKAPIYLSDRQLYEAFKHCGFIRQVESHQTCGYLQFDAESDAVDAVEKMDGVVLEECDIILKVAQIPDKKLNIPNVVIPLGIAEKEEPLPPPSPPPPPPPPPPRTKKPVLERKRDFERSKRERNREEAPNRAKAKEDKKREYKPKAWERGIRDYERASLDKL